MLQFNLVSGRSNQETRLSTYKTRKNKFCFIHFFEFLVIRSSIYELSTVLRAMKNLWDESKRSGIIYSYNYSWHLSSCIFSLAASDSGSVQQSVAYRGWGWGGGVQLSPTPKFRRPTKIVPNSTRLWKLLRIAEFRTPTPQDVRKKGNKILKLPSVRNCFTLAVTNKLVVIMNSLKVPKIKKILLYEMEIPVRNYRCLQNPWLEVYWSQITVFCPQLNLMNPPPPEQNSWVPHW